MSNYFKETPLWDSDHDRRLFDQGEEEEEEWPRKKRNEEYEDYDEDQDEDFITL